MKLMLTCSSGKHVWYPVEETRFCLGITFIWVLVQLTECESRETDLMSCFGYELCRSYRC